MQLIDPLQATCNRCSATSSQRVAELLGLRARCPACGAPLDEVGLQMRAGCDEWGEYCTAGFIMASLEKTLGDVFTDADLEGSHTLRDIARIVQHHLPPGPDLDAKSIELVREAAERLDWYTASEMDLDAPLMDAVDPSRWKRK